MSIMFRRPSRPSRCRMCGEHMPGGEISLAYWEKGGVMSGWRYTHIKCVLKLSQDKTECNKKQNPVSVKEALKSLRSAMAQVAIDKMRGKEDDEDF